MNRLLVRPASSSPREADCAGSDAGDGASACEFVGSFDRPGGKGAIAAAEASKPFVGRAGDAPRLPETWSMPSSLAMLSASSLLGAFACPVAAGPLLLLPPAPLPMSDSKMLAGPVELAAASAGAGAGAGAGLPSKNLANRDERPPPPRPRSTPSTGSRAAGDGEPRPGGARAMPRSSKIDLL